MKKPRIAIINRSFWPIYPVIGEALLLLAEELAPFYDVSVILQDQVGIRERLLREKRGEGVRFYSIDAWSTSASGVLRRVIDAVRFMGWVLGVLLWLRPKVVYVSTDPPILAPFVVAIYSKLSGARFIYHLQDIHPEAAHVVIKVRPALFKLLKAIDGFTMRRAHKLITLTRVMAKQIVERSGAGGEVMLLENPSVPFESIALPAAKSRGFSFCGNAGRLQRIPLLIDAIDSYHSAGGSLEFAFAGGGVYAKELESLAQRNSKVTYLGKVSSREAAELSSRYEWAILPIEDEVTEYAFPSKTSSYVFADARIIAICGHNTSVAEWVNFNHVGVVVPPTVDEVVQCFKRVEAGELSDLTGTSKRAELMERLSMPRFVGVLKNQIEAIV